MGTSFLTKSAFAEALSCPTKLYYFLLGYPKSTDENEYLELLAQGGFIIGALAQLKFPDGILMERTGNSQGDFEKTKELISRGDCTLFEATIISGQSLAITDILERKGNTLYLTEVKSKSFDGSENVSSDTLFRTKKGKISSEWLEYLYDVVFQYAVLKKAFPNFQIRPSLMLVDKSKKTTLDNLAGHFSIAQAEGQRPEVSVFGDKEELAKGAQILTSIDVSSEVGELLPMVEEKITYFEDILQKGKKVLPTRGVVCRDCEYRGENLNPSGYGECWNDIERSDTHIFDLYYGTAIKTNGELLFDLLITQGKTSLTDIPLEALSGKRGARQLIQIEYTKNQKEWVDPQLSDFIRTVRYPLHFIDFETTRTAIPFHAGMRPFEQIAFQWSCHTVQSRGSTPSHREWINTDPKFPNFEFARSLKDSLSQEGTVLTWAGHEANVLSDIVQQMVQYEQDDRELREFLELLVSSKSAQGRLVDMNRLTLDFYFHPLMKGRTRIKDVFPAIWRSNERIRKRLWFSEYESVKDDQILDPYKNLPSLTIGGTQISVQEGTGAMRAYEDMIFGEASKNPEEKENWKRLLLQYCKLDTLAMVAIWEHWEELSGVS